MNCFHIRHRDQNTPQTPHARLSMVSRFRYVECVYSTFKRYVYTHACTEARSRMCTQAIYNQNSARGHSSLPRQLSYGRNSSTLTRIKQEQHQKSLPAPLAPCACTQACGKKQCQQCAVTTYLQVPYIRRMLLHLPLLMSLHLQELNDLDITEHAPATHHPGPAVLPETK